MHVFTCFVTYRYSIATLYSFNRSLIYWYLLWTFLLRTTFHSQGSVGLLSPGLLEDLPGRSNSELTLTVSQPEGKDGHSNCVENPIRAKCAMPLFFPQPSPAQLWVSCLNAESLRPSRAAPAEGRPNSVPGLLLLLCERTWRGFLIKEKISATVFYYYTCHYFVINGHANDFAEACCTFSLSQELLLENPMLVYISILNIFIFCFTFY